MIVIEKRILLISEWQEWKALRLEMLQNYPIMFGASYEQELLRSDDYWKDSLNIDKNNVIFGAFVDGVLVGSVGFYVEHEEKKKHKGVLWGVYVKPEYRGKGVANDLMQAMIAHAKTKVIQVQLSVLIINELAFDLYQKYGFSIYGTEFRALQVDGRFYGEHLMVLNLDE